jgi:two-component system OmpR family response regulator
MDPLRVLIVDDETELVSTLVERLEIRGVEADGATDAQQALALAGENTYDVAVLDVKMPGMDGLELIRHLHKEQPELCVILLTGHGAAENVEKGLQYGAVDCLMKPVDIEVLLDVLNRAAGR